MIVVFKGLTCNRLLFSEVSDIEAKLRCYKSSPLCEESLVWTHQTSVRVSLWGQQCGRLWGRVTPTH